MVGVAIQGGGLPGEIEVAEQDVLELDRAGMIEITNVNIQRLGGTPSSGLDHRQAARKEKSNLSAAEGNSSSRLRLKKRHRP
jgi:hypothetical protein